MADNDTIETTTAALIDSVKAARRVSAPLLAVTTADQFACAKALFKGTDEAPKFTWDVARGLRPQDTLSEAALVKAVAAINEDRKKRDRDAEQLSVAAALAESVNPVAMLEVASKLPGQRGGGSMVVMFNAQRFVTADHHNAQTVQAVSNLRDQYKRDHRTLVMLGPSFNFPAEMLHDVVVLEEPLPDDKAVAAIATKIYDMAKMPAPDAATLAQAVDAGRGLSAFEAEQVYAMSLRKTGIDFEECWHRKRMAISQIKGLSLLEGGHTFKDIGGNDGAKDRVRELFRKPFSLVVFVDELEKYMAGLGGNGMPGDSNGLTQDQLNVLLRTMEDYGHTGMINVGMGGTGKSYFAKAIGPEFGAQVLSFDLGAMLGGIVGQSQANIREAVRVIIGLGGHNVFWAATCNDMQVLPTPLRRRFKTGTYYFDLPDASEKAAIWKINRALYGIPANDEQPEDIDWTAAEIRNTCENSARTGNSLKQEAQYIIPVAVSDPQGLDRLRTAAHMKWHSAATGRAYTRGASTEEVPDRALVVGVAEVQLPKTAGRES